MHSVPKGSETHFRVVIVSKEFEGLTSLKRQRLINEVLKEELSFNIHALSIQAITPEMWATRPQINSSPNCRGGMGL